MFCSHQHISDFLGRLAYHLGSGYSLPKAFNQSDSRCVNKKAAERAIQNKQGVDHALTKTCLPPAEQAYLYAAYKSGNMMEACKWLALIYRDHANHLSKLKRGFLYPIFVLIFGICLHTAQLILFKQIQLETGLRQGGVAHLLRIRKQDLLSPLLTA